MQRIKELDYLRGLAALSIMLYHYLKWLYIYDGANTFIGKMSVYGVELFYILSGITLYHVYHNALTSAQLKHYFAKRFFRIFPLFWLSIILAIGIGLKQVPLSKLLLNVSGLFSIFCWDDTIAPGTWSIGNELVFYLLFPCLIYMHKRSKIIFTAFGIGLFLLFSYFAFYIFDPSDTLHNQWSYFVNPLNHLFLFYVGMLIPMCLKRTGTSSMMSVAAILIGACLLFGFPSGTDGVHLIHGLHRWVYSFGSILICVGFYCGEFNLPTALAKAFKNTGEWSYSIYLLHPFVYSLLCILIRKMNAHGFNFPHSNALLISLAVITTLAVSKFVYRYVEVYFIKKGAAYLANSYKS